MRDFGGSQGVGWTAGWPAGWPSRQQVGQPAGALHHAIEIVADRGASAKVDPAVWESACAQFTNGCRHGRHVEGVISAIHTINQGLARAFPSGGIDTPDELPNEPLILR